MRIFSPLLACLVALGCRPSVPLTPAPEFDAPVQVNDVDGGWAQSEPTLVADSAGNLVVAWMDWSPPRPSVHFAISSNGGASFSASRPVHQPDPAHLEGQADVSLVRTRDGRIHLAWMACRDGSEPSGVKGCDILARTSGDRGRTWSPPVEIAAGGAIRRDRPWLATDGSRVIASWFELEGAATRFGVARLDDSGAWTPTALLALKSGVLPIAIRPDRLEALLIDASVRDPKSMVLDRMRSDDGGRTWESLGTLKFDRAAVLVEFSIGALAVQADGESWIAIPRGDGMRNDVLLAHRPRDLDVYQTVGTLRAGLGGRIALPWIEPLPGGRFLAVWMEEGGAGWGVRARVLGEGAARSAVATLSKAPFPLRGADPKGNVGESMAVAGAGSEVWVAWSDTTDGDADVRIARARLPAK